MRIIQTVLLLFNVAVFSAGCKKLVEISAPINSITTKQVFTSDQKAVAAVTGIYYDLSFSNNDIGFASGSMTIQSGLYSDELIEFGNPSNVFYQNDVPPDNPVILNAFWTSAYFDIYTANAALEGIQSSTAVTAATKAQLTGECKFLRAFCNFYLVNLFGNVPLVVSSDWKSNSLRPRDSASKVYDQIIADLKDAQELLGEGYPGSGDRVRANKWAAAALLARVYLYKERWQDAIDQATAVINNSSLYAMGELDNIFAKNGNEAIFQLQCVTRDNYAFATQEGNLLVPPPYSWAVPAYAVTPELLSSFEANDNRKTSWLNSAIVEGETVNYPFKYKLRSSSAGEIAEYNTPLRLAEQYLIRAEAYAHLSNNTQSLEDVDTVRRRAGLSDLPASIATDDLLTAIAHENRVEYFAEWGHRWLDLKRTGQASAVLGPVKGAGWKSTDVLWPIPKAEITNDPNLKQNAGYQ